MVRETSSVLKGKEVKDKILKGSEITASAVSTTYGPFGTNVALTRIYNPPHITKDGVTVASSINLKDPIENISAQVIKAAADKTAKVAGDGTTSTTILANELTKRCIQYLEENPSQGNILRKELEDASYKLSVIIDAWSKPIGEESGSEDLYTIALVASNGDRVLAGLVTSAFKEIGTDGIVTVTESKSYDTLIDTTAGIKLDRSHISPALAGVGMKTEFKNPKIIITNLDIKTAMDGLYLVELTERAKSPILVICNDLTDAALEVIAYNQAKHSIPITAVRAPYIAEARLEACRDLAIATGAMFIEKEQGWSIQDITDSHLGSADTVEITSQETNIIGRNGDKEAIAERIDYYNDKIKNDHAGLTSNYKKRIALLTGGASVIYVGGTNEVEIGERKDRLDDTIRAVKSALSNGVVPGAGITYKKLSLELNKRSVGEKILQESLVVLPLTILENKLNRPATDSELKAFLEEATEQGILDPALVITSTIVNAIGAAIMLFNTNCVVIKEENYGN